MDITTPKDCDKFLAARILEELKKFNAPTRAVALAQRLLVARSDVNRLLYRMEKGGLAVKDNGTPPLWSFVPEESAPPSLPPLPENDGTTTVVLVDLGNVHDCLQQLVPYADMYPPQELQVYAFADVGYNGFGVNPAPKSPNITVFQAKTRDSNAADMELIWKVAEFVLGSAAQSVTKAIQNATYLQQHRYHFIVATKDQGFQSLQTIVQRYYHSLDFVSNWEELRKFIE